MEGDSDSNSSSDNGDGRQCTPKESVSFVNVEDLTSAFNKMSGLCVTPKPERSASRLRNEARGRVLFPKQEQVKTRWLEKEDYALTLFLLFHTDGRTWVSHRDEKFWCDAGIFVQHHSQSAHCRTG